MSDEVTTRLLTAPEIEAEPPCFRVTWIEWDSGFRGSGLIPGDRIVAVDGQPIAPPPPGSSERSTWQSRAVGQYAEAQAWERAHKGEGARVTLTVLRRAPPVGWQRLSFTGTLRPQVRYTTPSGSVALGDGGPEYLATDGFSGGWTGWYTREIVPAFTAVLDEGWETPSFSSRYELSQHLERRERVEFLVQHYPGGFARALQADYQAVLASLEGPDIQLDDAALRYRVAEQDRADRVREEAQTAWTAFRAGIAATAIEPFPAVHPIRGDLASVVGRHVLLPPLRNRDWVSEAGHTWFAAGSDYDGWYFADGDGDPAGLMLRALRRYRRKVAPNIDETYQLVGRIGPDPRLLVINDVSHFGLQIDLVAALIGDSLFVDLGRVVNGEARFAGEDAFDQPAGALPPDDASPTAVMQAAIDALKAGDQPLWSALFARFELYHVGADRPVIRSRSDRRTDDDWERSRRAILGQVFDVRVAWAGDPRTIVDGTAYPGAPRLEEVDVTLDHVGRFDGAYRLFANSTVRRRWALQRLDGGPWRIATYQSI